MERQSLGAFEAEILSMLIQQPMDAYGSTIRRCIAERTGREPSLGAIYTTLERMEAKGFVKSWWGEPTAERGGKRKRYYKIEAPGQEAVQRTRARQTLWSDTAHALPAGA